MPTSLSVQISRVFKFFIRFMVYAMRAVQNSRLFKSKAIIILPEISSIEVCVVFKN